MSHNLGPTSGASSHGARTLGSFAEGAGTDLAAPLEGNAPQGGCCGGKKNAEARAGAETPPSKSCGMRDKRAGEGAQAPAVAPDKPTVAGACCRPEIAPKAAASTPPASPSLPPPFAEGAAELERLQGLPQYRHPFVEGCTCGSGIIACCPCTVGLAEHGAMQAGASHGPLMLLAGGFGVVGAVLGVRAITTNLEAAGRVARARAHNDERLGWLQSMRHRLAPATAGAAAPAAKAALHGQIVAAQRRQRALADSAAERRFNLWAGAVQLVGSVAMVLASLQHGFGLLRHAPNFAALATGVLAGYAGLYAARVLWRTGCAWRAFRAARAAGRAEPGDAFRQQVLTEAKGELRRQTLAALAWTALAPLSAASVLLPAIGVGLGVGVGVALGAATVAAQLAAVATSIAWPSPVHTPSGPRLDEAYDAAALADPALRRSWEQTSAAQVDLLRACSRVLLTAPTPGAWRQRLAHRVEPWTTPQCGPKAYAAVADAFAKQRGPRGAWPADVDAGVARYLRHEASWLVAADAAQTARVQAVAKELNDERAKGPEGAAEGRAPYLRRGLDDLLAELRRSQTQLAARRAAVEASAATWEALAAGPRTGEATKRTAAMLRAATALGLLGEVAGPWISRRPAWFYAAPTAGQLAFGHVVLRPECVQQLAEAMGTTLPHAFVRSLLNPNRLVAERAELLTAGAEFAPLTAPSAAQASGATGAGHRTTFTKVASPTPADAGFGGCSSCA